MIYTYTQAFKDGLKPDPLLSFAGWSEQFYTLPPSASGGGQLIDMRLTPYLPQILEDLSWISTKRQIYFMAGVQVAKSSVSDIIICGTVDYFPSPIIMYFPSDTMAMEYVKTRIEPCFDDNPQLKGKLRDGFDKKSRSTIGLKLFKGGSAKFIGGISEKAYRSYTAAIVIFNDIDSLPRDVGGTEKRTGQGSPIPLGINRTNARQGKYKIYIEGSPTDTETSLIYNDFLKTDQKYYHVPCPYCGQLQKIDFFRIKFDRKNDEVIKMHGLECEKCNKIILESKKFWMMQPENGATWVSENEIFNADLSGYQLSSAYSLLGYDWTKMSNEFLFANRQQKNGNPKYMVTFKNTKLGLPWDSYRHQKSINHTELYESRENWVNVPEDGVIITAGIDIQAQRIEVLVCAFGEKSDVYCLEYKVIGGDTLIEYGLEGSPFNELEEFLNKKYVNSWEKEQPILHSCIDMGFRSITVSPFLQKMVENGLEITGISGSSHSKKGKTFVGEPKINKYGVNQREVNVDEGKTLNHHKLKTGLIHFNEHPSFTDSFFRQFTVERWDDKTQRWICPQHARNEATDMLNYSTVAYVIYSNNGNIDWESFKDWNKNGCQIITGKYFETLSEGVRI